MDKLLLLTIIILAFTYSSIAQNDQRVDELKSAAPHMPAKVEGSLENHPEYREKMYDWAKNYPREFAEASKLDGSLNIFAPIQSASSATGISRDEPEKAYNPAFMQYPVNASKPVLINKGNPDWDKIVYQNKLQHWYYRYDKDGYVKNYGELPKLKEFPQPILHPDEFGEEVDPANYQGYYPEFE